MKANIDWGKKKAKVNFDAEGLVEKKMELNEKNWKEKFTTKHNAKKEIMELKHKQDLESKEQSLKKKSFVKELVDGINERQQNKLEEKRLIEEERLRREEETKRKEEEERLKVIKERRILGIILMIFGLLSAFIGFIFIKGDNEYASSLGFMVFIIGLTIYLCNSGNKKKK